MKELTERQKEILEFISSYTAQNGFSPSIRDIGEYYGKSIKAIQDHLMALQKKGYLSKSDGRSRSFKVLDPDGKNVPVAKFTRIPILGTVAAGKPLLSEENIESYVSLSEPFIKPGKNYFALRVRGTSMINAGILEGDLAIIEQTETAVDGQIIVAVLDDAITLKRFYKESNRVRLQPENPEFDPIYSKNVRIAGSLAGLIRSY